MCIIRHYSYLLEFVFYGIFFTHEAQGLANKSYCQNIILKGGGHARNVFSDFLILGYL